jgi:hypothetical protein
MALAVRNDHPAIGDCGCVGAYPTHHWAWVKGSVEDLLLVATRGVRQQAAVRVGQRDAVLHFRLLLLVFILPPLLFSVRIESVIEQQTVHGRAAKQEDASEAMWGAAVEEAQRSMSSFLGQHGLELL